MAETRLETSDADMASVACVLTPTGRGAIAVVSVSGPTATEAVDSLFRAASSKPLREAPINRVAFGRWGDASGEEVVVTRLDHCVEIHCHGGVAASRAIVASLAAAGCREVDQSEWLRRNSEDAIAVAALEQLSLATTETAALVLLDQLNGALRREVQQAIALIDAGELAAAAELLNSLYARWTTGRRLTNPARVVLTGPPNVGKSSLINALVGYQRAIVFPAPGTTRDVVTATTAIDGWAVELIDTAGLRADATGVELSGMQLARNVIARADLVLRVTEADKRLAGERATSEFDAWVADRTVVEVANKTDRLSPEQLAQLKSAAGDNLVLSSAVSPGGIDKLLATISQHIVPPPLPEGSATPFTEQQATTLAAASLALSHSDRATAKQTLLAMLG